MNQRSLKIESFQADENLLYLVQATCNESSADILSYFYSVANEIAVSAQTTKADKISRRLTAFYPNSTIPICINVRGAWREHHRVWITVGFPPKKNKVYGDLAQVIEKIVEARLLGGEEPALTPFTKPGFRFPSGTKKMFKEQIKKAKNGTSN